MTRLALGLALVLASAGCGDDKPSARPQQPNQPAKPAAPAAGAGSGSAMPAAPKIEKMISDAECPVPREDAKACDPTAERPVMIFNDKPDPNDRSCPEGQYCLPTQKGFLCGPCPERVAIREAFRETDFAPETNRDPFQSFIVKAPTTDTGNGSGSAAQPVDPASRCRRPDQMRVPNYSYQELKLVGIVAQRTRRKVLMMDPSNYGHIIKRGDCVGKEKAWVKDITENLICFEVTDPTLNRVIEPPCVELHNKQISLTPQPGELPPASSPRVPAPTRVPAPQVPPPPTTTPGPTRRRVPAPQPEARPQVPLQAPTILNP